MSYKNQSGKEDKIEVKVHHKDSSLTLYFELEDDFKTFREVIKSTFNYMKINQFEVYVGNYHLNDLFDDLKIKIVTGLFLHNEFKIIPSNEKDPFSIYGAGKSLDMMLNLHKDTVDNYMSVHDVADYSIHCYQDMSLLAQNLKNIYDDICKEEEFLKKNGLLARYDKLSRKVEDDTAAKDMKEDYLSQCFIKILELKNMERQAVEYVRENKKLMAVYYENQNKIENKSREISNVNHKQLNIIKKKENEARLLENYIAPNKKITIQGKFINLTFLKFYKKILF
jgi:hypothetical protein